MAADIQHTTTASDYSSQEINAQLAADRQQAWNRFCQFLTWSIAGTVALLVFLAVFVA